MAEDNIEERDVDFSELEAPTGGDSDAVENQGSEESASGDGALQQEIAALKEELRENKTKYLRALADLENFQKRAVKERSELLKFEGTNIFVDMLEVVDNFELALQHMDADPEQIQSGVEMIHRQFTEFLSKWQVTGEPSVGKEFNPEVQSAISKVETIEDPAGTVLSELKKSYFYKEKLIRPGEVVVAVAPEEADEESSSDSGESGEE